MKQHKLSKVFNLLSDLKTFGRAFISGTSVSIFSDSVIDMRHGGKKTVGFCLRHLAHHLARHLVSSTDILLMIVADTSGQSRRRNTSLESQVGKVNCHLLGETCQFQNFVIQLRETRSAHPSCCPSLTMFC
ncbi:hypothetical protein DAPPUDRAFT_97223 [Daphnia pulex]|uniref:Uncharacterized protein n=1 Tax=Daphnia pulex TaxID=6669 RepID=E9FZ80_DAPPU|nr:hypothetical protein DAPPUDRAFT_97223 [Daphnia pulex]|eukprot:EFX87312.1 hypothetical protein DAPPUDRAFT_97223 [Daphnia pulex]